MSTHNDLIGNKKSFIRRLNRSNGTITINIPHPIIKKTGLRGSDYMKVTYRDDQNNIVLSKINMNEVEEKEL